MSSSHAIAHWERTPVSSYTVCVHVCSVPRGLTRTYVLEFTDFKGLQTSCLFLLPFWKTSVLFNILRLYPCVTALVNLSKWSPLQYNAALQKHAGSRSLFTLSYINTPSCGAKLLHVLCSFLFFPMTNSCCHLKFRALRLNIKYEIYIFIAIVIMVYQIIISQSVIQRRSDKFY